MKKKLFSLFILFTIIFTYFSYTVARERWQQIDFDTMVKVQDHINPKRNLRVDAFFSYFSLLGSIEVTVGFCLVLAVASFLRRRWLSAAGWLMIVPASLGEVFGKLTVFHPGPPVFFHRSILPAGLPSFYVHTNFSYPSGHMVRTVFIITVFVSALLYSRKTPHKLIAFSVLALLALMMAVTRVYLGEHWLSDVLGGSLLGAAVGFMGSVLILKTKRS